MKRLLIGIVFAIAYIPGVAASGTPEAETAEAAPRCEPNPSPYGGDFGTVYNATVYRAAELLCNPGPAIQTVFTALNPVCQRVFGRDCNDLP